MHKIKQPILTQTELNKIDAYQKYISKHGYKPWTTVRSSHTHGQGQILSSHITHRVHHLLSRGELLVFLTRERDAGLVDILDQYPLPIHETLKIADELQIFHPSAFKERFKHDGKIPAKTMSTDLVLIYETSPEKKELVPYSFKYSHDLQENKDNALKHRRTLKKLEIEHEFWSRNGTNLNIVTELDFCKTEVYNLKFLRQCYDYPELLNISTELRTRFLHKIRSRIINLHSATLKEHLINIAQCLELDLFQSLCIFQQLVFERHLDICTSHKIELFRPINIEGLRECELIKN